ncbi:MAG TPA: nicotinamide riboside transporter PnuC [Bacteroidia bacterium]|jgi:nicotinamide mononucleotide transporter|nr:nicotinamide riboside transporter PnuC [Bacteroidia bacterium]
MLFISQQDIYHYIAEHWLEIIAVALSIAGVWLTALEKIINWPINIIASAVYVYIFYISGIYLDTGISVFYISFGFYGWYYWLYGGSNKKQVEISKVSVKELFTLIAMGIPITIGLAVLLIHFTNSTIPYLDSSTTVLSLIATWMAAKKHIENWLVWIIADSIYVVEYIIKDLYLTALLYFIFTVLAAYGYFEWNKQLKKLSALPL